MADEESLQDPPEQNETEGAAGSFKDVEDSLALTRTKTAYQPEGKRYTQSLKEKKVPQRVIAAQMNPLDPFTEDDIDDETLIAPSRHVIGSAYKDTAQTRTQPSFQPVAESNSGDDILALQSSENRNVQTVSFKVKGIQWRAGFANELSNTPLGHAIHPAPLPAYREEIAESLKKAGIVIRPVNPRLRVVLNQLLPPDFRKKVAQQRKKTDRMKLLAIFYLPGTPSSHVGFIHEFTGSKSDFKFYLYIQTSVGKAPVAILDEVLKTLEAGLPEGEKASDLDEYEAAEEEDDLPEVEIDFAGEVEQAMKQAGDTFNNSIMVYGARQANRVVKDWSMELIRLVDKGIARIIRMATWFVIQLANSRIIRAMAALVQFISKGLVNTIWGMNKVFLAIGRSPVTKAIFENIVRVFKVIGRLFLVVWFGIKWVFQTSVAFFAYLGSFVRDPKGTSFSAVSIEFPSFGKGLFGESGAKGEKNKDKKALAQVKKTQLTANKHAAKRLPPPKPLKKPNAATTPALPAVKPGTKASLPGATGSGSSAAAAAAAAKAKRDRELGYFEDQAF
ncbi:hypothetical protein COW36_00055 [bacterium (Candidatus Blackallbacteria) CG17_big_fil_post_rev_8_21_14_2_50_48_46]|uniref:Uncharacterized protein n=1 Tax=bacterium (Candidatus Blackallbacteria) CG17_big_fil_post_rev_8_21_14_2_50_48_46 TaxID=2014261 RepID=A0A2M7GBY7_9BACT|nr:MAG: hypothetical protein COW64_07835 [bacterium (Candidatus Blackallbacteria) CG18_big_fil_WC_8_21_14_2_50_49_26]PIW19660.1 MAG: hypothetical protein COW36_00055 [bacterium (Candidatus Blackallbacteria) CG17_big_fil_post_rev_8_21_14_2_50_48_46]PIW44731.1 MAG: hypothetical protein COW20_22970 [bacterium (Candidatus Blackallbacteria) CG13_big_fil_rev_8_21_14_2_50_49_14]